MQLDTTHARAFALLLASASTGCISSHEEGDMVPAHATETYEGFSDRAQDTVYLEALNQATGRWTRVAETVSSTRRTRIGGVDLYAWRASFRLDSLSAWRCYAHPGCTPTEGASRMRLRARSAQGRFGGDDGFVFYTYGEGELNCTLAEVSGGSSLPVAYDTCTAGEHKRELVLWVGLF